MKGRLVELGAAFAGPQQPGFVMSERIKSIQKTVVSAAERRAKALLARYDEANSFLTLKGFNVEGVPGEFALVAARVQREAEDKTSVLRESGVVEADESAADIPSSSSSSSSLQSLLPPKTPAMLLKAGVDALLACPDASHLSLAISARLRKIFPPVCPPWIQQTCLCALRHKAAGNPTYVHYNPRANVIVVSVNIWDCPLPYFTLVNLHNMTSEEAIAFKTECWKAIGRTFRPTHAATIASGAVSAAAGGLAGIKPVKPSKSDC